MLSRLSECDKSVLKLRGGTVILVIFLCNAKKGSFAHLVAEQHDDHVLLGILVYFSQPGLKSGKETFSQCIRGRMGEQSIKKTHKYHRLKAAFSASS